MKPNKHTIAFLFLLLGMTLPVQAYTLTTVNPGPSTCPVNFQVDSQTVPQSCPNLYFRVTVEPDTFGLVAANDNPTTQPICNGSNGPYCNDLDYNDASVQFYTLPSTAGLDTVYVSWYVGLSSQVNSIEINGYTFNAANEAQAAGYFPVGTFAVGTELDFLELTGDGHTYNSLSTTQGPESYFWESQTVSGDTLKGTPEPGTLSMLGLGLLGIIAGKLKGRK